MQRILLIGSKDPAGKNDIVQMHQQLTGLLKNADLKLANWEDLVVTIETGSQKIIDANNNDVADNDLVLAFNWYKSGQGGLYRDLAFTLGLYLEHHGVKFWNSEIANQRSTSKLSATMQLSLLGLPVPKTRFSLDSSKLLQETLSTPFICKSAVASRGADNYFCHSIDEAKSHLDNGSTNHFIIQEYIDNEADWRIICFGGQPKLAIERRRQSDDTHLNNTSQGANAQLIEFDKLPAKVIDECKQICYKMGREMAGIDVLPERGNQEQYVYLEVNAIPQLTSGSFVDEKMKVLAESLNKSEQG